MWNTTAIAGAYAVAARGMLCPSMIRARIVQLAICGYAVATASCGGHDKRPWNELAIPGVELYLEVETRPPYRQSGVATVSGRTLYGKAAFDAVRPRAASDAPALPTLAMLLLDDGVAGQKPWTQPLGGARPADEEAIAVPPAVS